MHLEDVVLTVSDGFQFLFVDFVPDSDSKKIDAELSGHEGG
jgi:hypothetical protein